MDLPESCSPDRPFLCRHGPLAPRRRINVTMVALSTALWSAGWGFSLKICPRNMPPANIGLYRRSTSPPAHLHMVVILRQRRFALTHFPSWMSDRLTAPMRPSADVPESVSCPARPGSGVKTHDRLDARTIYLFPLSHSAVGYFLAGVAALVFIIDFTQLSGRASGLAQYTLATGLWISAMRMPMVSDPARAVCRPVCRHGHAHSAEPEI